MSPRRRFSSGAWARARLMPSADIDKRVLRGDEEEQEHVEARSSLRARQRDDSNATVCSPSRRPRLGSTSSNHSVIEIHGVDAPEPGRAHVDRASATGSQEEGQDQIRHGDDRCEGREQRRRQKPSPERTSGREMTIHENHRNIWLARKAWSSRGRSKPRKAPAARVKQREPDVAGEADQPGVPGGQPRAARAQIGLSDRRPARRRPSRRATPARRRNVAWPSAGRYTGARAASRREARLDRAQRARDAEPRGVDACRRPGHRALSRSASKRLSSAMASG